jgi:GH35 family endo-1,4-beta-xylanase
MLFGFLLLISGTNTFSQVSTTLTDSIRKHRQGYILVKTTPNAKVKLEQISHEFWFGAAIANSIFDGSASATDVEKYKQVFLENFNSAVTENALKWGTMEREKGKVDFATVDNMLVWTDAHQIPLRGHNLYWGIDQFVQDWVKNLDDQELTETLHTRARTIAPRYKGRFAEYDLNNEMIHGNYYEKRLGPDITRKMAEWIQDYDPETELYLNDYDILTGNRLEDYVKHIQALLDQGVPVGGIGVQGHLHGEDFDPAALRNALDVLAKFDLPIKVTEFNIPGQRSKFYKDRSLQLTPEEEQRKAENLVTYYRICFAHPAVDGILMWGFWEGGNWIPVSSLYNKDWSPTPAAEAYQKLIFDEWWTRFEGKADKQGYCVVPAFFGKHKVTVNGEEKMVELKKETGAAKVEMGSR